jgi:hypothetical protein
MIKILTAVALAIALPAMVQAQAAQVAPKADCCEKMKDMDCCKDMAKMDRDEQDMKAATDPHAGHGMTKSAAKAPSADVQHDHQN